MHFSVSIESNLVCVTCELDSYDPADLGLIVGRASHLAASFLDLLSFAVGISLTLSLDTLLLPDNRVVPLVNAPMGLRILCTSFDLTSDSYFDVLTMLLADPKLATALNDLIAGVGSHRQAQINCARAIEGLRALMSPGETSRARAWEVFRQNLRVDERYISLILTASTQARHGHFQDSGPAITAVVERSWVLMDRYFAFARGGYKPLSEQAFPVLTG